MAFQEKTSVSHPPQRVFEGLTSREFQVHVADGLRASVDEFQVSPAQPTSADTVSVTISRSIEGEQIANRLPAAVQRFVKGRVQVEQVESWSAANDQGARDANVTIKVPLAKATGTATIRLVPSADGSSTTVEIAGSVESKIPLMGPKIAQLAEPQVGKLLTGMTAKLERWLDQR